MIFAERSMLSLGSVTASLLVRPPDFVQNDQALAGCVIEDIGRLVHFYHEGGLSFQQIILRPDPGEDAVYQSQFRFLRWYVTADLRH